MAKCSVHVSLISFFFLISLSLSFTFPPSFPSSSLPPLPSLLPILLASPPSQSIFDILAEMNPKPKALVLDWSHHVTQLFNCFAKLLAHPLQRPVQTQMDSKLSPLS